MIERDGEVSVKRQAQLLDLSRSSVYYVARGLPERDLKLMRILDELHLKWPFYGARKLTRELQAKIGQLTMENDFLEGALGKFPGPSGKR